MVWSEADLPAFLVEVPGVGVCQNDLHLAARALVRGFGGGHNTETPLDVVKGAVRQASTELRLVAESIWDAEEPAADEYFSLLSIAERLESAIDSAEILCKLLQLPHVNMRRHNREHQGHAGSREGAKSEGG